MVQSLGQIVYLFKDRSSSVLKRTACHTLQMPQRQEKEGVTPATAPVRWVSLGKTRFRKIFAARVAQARAGAGLTQERVAELLGISQTRYSKYEKRSEQPKVVPSAMPPELIDRFCEVTGAKAADLFRDPRRSHNGQ
jgi:DNA-binding XRE family transcriptional regulator